MAGMRARAFQVSFPAKRRVHPFRKTAFLREALLDFLFPPRCGGCSRLLRGDEDSFCSECGRTFRNIGKPFCPVCGLPFKADTASSHLCAECERTPPAFDAARAGFIYEGAVRHTLLKFKYGRKPYLARILGAHLADRAERMYGETPWDHVVPVPLHPKRLRSRGFNQSLLLAQRVGKRTGTVWSADLIRRIRPTRPQAELSGAARRKNVQGAFGIQRPEACRNKRFLLVDDVFTTSATVQECAKVLKQAGADRVYVLTVARTVAWHWEPS